MDKIPRATQPTGAPPAALAALARAREVAARHQEAAATVAEIPDVETLTSSGMDDDFTFVPDPPASARSAAADLRSALG